MIRLVIPGLLAAALALAGDARGHSPPPSPQATFRQVAGWQMLRWEMRLPAARQALKAAGVPFRERPMHKDGTTHLLLDSGGWAGVVYFDQDERMVQILFQSPYLKTEPAARDALARLEQLYGPAAERRRQRYRDEQRLDEFHVWRNAATVLTVTLARYLARDEWVVWEAYTPAAGQ